MSCIAENARENTAYPYKDGVDFVPVTPDDQVGFYVVYSPKKGYTYNVTMSIIPIDRNRVILFGTGYGDCINSERGPEEDMALVHHTIQECLGFDSPENVKVFVVSPHYHPDHIGPESVAALRGFGYEIASIIIHEAGLPMYLDPPDWWWPGENPEWTDADRAVVDIMQGGDCETPLRAIDTEIGHVWLRLRPGHTEDSIDLVIDVQSDPENRVMILGSRPGGACGRLPGTRLVIKAHGNVIIP